MQRRPGRLRSAFAVLLALLAFAASGTACAVAPGSGPATLRARGPGSIERAAPPLASAFLPGGGASLDPSVRPIGPLAGVAPGRGAADARRVAPAGAGRAARPAFARGLAAARD